MIRAATAKGQSSAPFEVLVAVIIMSFVMYMALQAFDFLKQKQCEAEMKNSMADLKSKVEETIRGGSALLKFLPPNCFRDETVMRLEVVSSKPQCRSICGKEVSQCLFFKYRSSVFNYELCFDSAPTFTNFLDQTSCPTVPNTRLVNFRDPGPLAGKDIIPRGIYNLQNLTGSGENVPKICAYLQTRPS